MPSQPVAALTGVRRRPRRRQRRRPPVLVRRHLQRQQRGGQRLGYGPAAVRVLPRAPRPGGRGSPRGRARPQDGLGPPAARPPAPPGTGLERLRRAAARQRGRAAAARERSLAALVGRTPTRRRRRPSWRAAGAPTLPADADLDLPRHSARRRAQPLRLLRPATGCSDGLFSSARPPCRVRAAVLRDLACASPPATDHRVAALLQHLEPCA
mmetsp:Transcript_97294/g.253727  ORF Transcript_97294/g.253727 Transcript_97294/m.253727 type:complete len:211 (+) Transcript_97294:354-986(+)